jgi:hypothetical protein
MRVFVVIDEEASAIDSVYSIHATLASAKQSEERFKDMVNGRVTSVVEKELNMSETAKEKLEYINGHWTGREFPRIDKVDLQWVGAVLDFLEEIGLGSYR